MRTDIAFQVIKILKGKNTIIIETKDFGKALNVFCNYVYNNPNNYRYGLLTK